MDQSGRYRSRIGKPSGLRPPSARGAAAAGPAPCPAAQGVAPCPATQTAGPSRLPRIPKPASRLPEPRMQRVASPPRTRVPGPETGAIPKRTGLRPPASYAVSSRLPAAPRPVREIPQPKPKAPIASTVPVARVVSPAPRAVSPARTLAVPIPQEPPAEVCPAAVVTPRRRSIPQPSRLRRPLVRAESLVAVPVVQEPGSPPKRILVPESVAASEQETIVAVPKVATMGEVDRRFAEMERRLYLEGTAAPCFPIAQTTAAAPSPPRTQAVAAAMATSPRHRISQPSRLRRPAVKPENMVAIPVVQEPGSPPKRILVPESVAASEQETIVAVPKPTAQDDLNRIFTKLFRKFDEEDAEALRYLRAQTPAAEPCCSRAQAVAAVSPAAVATPRRIPQPSRLRRPAVKPENMVAIPVVQEPGSPPKRILVPESVVASEQETIVAVPKTTSLDEMNWIFTKSLRKVDLEDAEAPCSVIVQAPCSPLPNWEIPPAPSVSQNILEQEERKWEAMQRKGSTPPRSSPIVGAPRSPREAAAVINQVVELASEAVINELLEKAAAARAKGVEEAFDFFRRFAQDRNRPKLPREVLEKIYTDDVKKYMKQRKKNFKIDSFWKLYEKYGRRAANIESPPSPFKFILSNRLPTYTAFKKRWDDLQLLAAETPLIEDEEMPEYYEISPEEEEEELSRISLSEIDPEAAFILEVASIPSSANLKQRWEALRRLAAKTRLIEDEEMPEHYSLSSEGEELSSRTPPEIDPEAAFVLGGMVEAVAQEEAERESTKAGPIVIDLTSSPELDVDTETRRLPRPLTPQRVLPSSRRGRRRRRSYHSPTLRSPLDSPPRHPVDYLKMMNVYKSPEYIDDPFKNPPQLPPLYKHLGIKFLDIDELEAFLAGKYVGEEERRCETEEDEEWTNESPQSDFYIRHTPYYSRHRRT